MIFNICSIYIIVCVVSLLLLLSIVERGVRFEPRMTLLCYVHRKETLRPN